MEEVIQEKQRKRWSRDETMGFLRCYLARKAEFQHPKKKRLAYANVLEDMVSLAITDSERTPICLESKMRSLLQAYKSARDNNRSTGASPCFAPYMELMDEIFGTSPIISNDHTVHVGYRSFKTLTVRVDSASPSSSPKATSPQVSPSLVSTPLPSPSPSSSSMDSAQIASTSELSPSPSSPLLPRKRTARDIYYENKFKLRKLEAEEKQKARNKAMEDLKEMLREKWQKDRELEMKKVALLEKIANRE